MDVEFYLSLDISPDDEWEPLASLLFPTDLFDCNVDTLRSADDGQRAGVVNDMTPCP
jgi:hypothetical protein